MRELDVQCIADKIAQLCVEANHYLGEDIKACIPAEGGGRDMACCKGCAGQHRGEHRYRRRRRIPALSGYGYGVCIPGDRAGCASDRRGCWKTR